MDDLKNIAETAFEKAEEYLDGKIVTATEPGTGVEVIGVLRGGTFTSIPASAFDANRTAPKRITDKAELYDLDSFIAYTNRFKNKASALFLHDDLVSPSLKTVFDYHAAGEHAEQGGIDPHFGDHRATFEFPLSAQWERWISNNGKAMAMIDFATFLEDNIVDVLGSEFVTIAEGDDETKRFFAMMGGKAALAEPAKLLEVANNLTINEKSVVTNAQNLSSGEGAIEFRSEHEATTSHGKKVTVPKMFAIGVPVFKNGQSYRVFARLRYRKAGGTINFHYELWQVEKVFEHAISEAAEKAQAGTELPLYIGRDR
jgi:uncharacterized protein YfdQ (DUF2303 family)